MPTHKEENDILFNGFLEKYFFEPFRCGQRSLELIVSPLCCHKCSYCYLVEHASDLFSHCDCSAANILANLDKVLDWSYQNNFRCNIDLFSGELFAQEVGYQICERIYSFYKDKPADRRIPSIVIPTNFSFICSEECTARVERIIDDFADIGINVYLSASFDGKHMEANRPYAHNLDFEFSELYSDEYYDRLFRFSKKHGFGFHPMLYFDGIDKWKDNFDWFQSMFAKYDIPWHNIYLLQVRNDGWTPETNRSLYDFIDYITQFAYKKCGKDAEHFVEFLGQSQHGFNILSEPFAQHDRGIGCGLQNSFGIRLPDLAHFPCHRTMYPDLKIGGLAPDGDGFLRYQTEDAELGLTVYGFSTRTQPLCIKCPINRVCIGGCLGSQFEINKDLFSPIHSVCQNSFWLAKAVVDALDRIGALDMMIKNASPIKAQQLKFVREIDIGHNI